MLAYKIQSTKRIRLVYSAGITDNDAKRPGTVAYLHRKTTYNVSNPCISSGTRDDASRSHSLAERCTPTGLQDSETGTAAEHHIHISDRKTPAWLASLTYTQ